MKLNSLFKPVALLAAGVVLLNSCDKVEKVETVGDAGPTIVKIRGVDKTLINVNLVSTPQVLNMVDIRRDAANTAELNKTMTVVIKDEPGAVSTYNTTHGTNFVPIPAALYTIDPSNPKVGSDYTVTLQPGEFAKNLKFNLPSALALDLNKQYAFGFSIKSVDAGGQISATDKTIVVEIGAKNQWDGVYRLKSKFFLHPTYGVFPGFESDKFELHTAGSSTMNKYWAEYAEYSQPFVIDATGALNRFGGLSLQFIINPTTNAITITNNGPDNTTALEAVTTGYNNRYDPATKTFYIAFGYRNAAGALRFWGDTLTYLRPR
jgi:hypothetical protein